MVRRLAAVDAQTYWMSAKIPNDPFLLYGFAGVPANLEQAIDVIRGRADECAELRLRIRDGNVLTYPAWVSGEVNADQFVVHDLDDNRLGGLSGRRCRTRATNQLDAHGYDLAAARLHPGRWNARRAGTGTVAVLQITHALADGVRSSALAARLFGRAWSGANGEAPPRLRGFTLPWRSIRRRACRTASWSATPKPAWCPRRRIHDPRCAPTPGRRERAPCAPWSGAATSWPARL